MFETGEKTENKANAIEIDGLRKVYSRKDKDVEVIRDITLNIKEGDFVSIVGPSGCGKSTFLHIVGGFIDNTAGTVKVRGKEVSKPGPDRGMMFQESALFPWRKVYGNVAWGLEMKKLCKKEIAERVEHYLRLVGLWDFRNHLPSELSGGMRQRVSLAKTLAINPDVLLMDEPFGALDAQTREVMQDELLRIWTESQKSVLFVTHDIDEAVYLSDYIVALSKRPTTVKEIVKVDLDRPRNMEIRKSYKFVDYRNYVWDLLQEEDNVTSIGGSSS